MGATSKIICIISLILIGYGYWGAFTNAGNKVYDEMDGYYPFFILLAGMLMLVTTFIIVLVKKRKMRKG